MSAVVAMSQQRQSEYFARLERLKRNVEIVARWVGGDPAEFWEIAKRDPRAMESYRQIAHSLRPK